MDVTSMLNETVAAAAGQQIVTPPPPRTRTPWDAGGFALPIHQRESSTESQKHESPLSPVESYSKHGPSDSRSSLSSFASSASTAHSRFSSTSTFSGFNSHGGPLQEDGYIGSSDDMRERSKSIGSPSPVLPAPGINFSKCESQLSLNALAMVAEDRLKEGTIENSGLQAPLQNISQGPLETCLPAQSSPELVNRRMSRSPSDALMIPRPNRNVRQQSVEEGSLHGGNTSDESSTTPHVSPELTERSPQLVGQSRAHKRSMSAPNFPDFRSLPPKMASLDIVPERMSSTNYSANQSISEYFADGDIPVNSSAGELQPACHFQAGCDTGSPPRKAISHIFGRNKMCTRLIPEHYWVHLCRKHYQRSRYRNPAHFAQNMQCELVEKQIRNVEQWSEENVGRGKGGILKDWNLAVRKREQKRLAAIASIRGESPSSSPRGRTSDRSAAPASAPPEWLQGLCGSSYSTQEMLDILIRLKQEMFEGVVLIFPDIEILPNITVDCDEPSSPKGYNKRNTSHRGHRRSQSMGSVLSSDSHRSSEPPSFSMAGGHHASNKRKTYESRDDSLPSHVTSASQIHRGRNGERSPELGRRQLPRAQMRGFSDIREHEVYEGDRGYYYTPGGRASPVLQAPVARRRTSLSTAAHLDSALSGRYTDSAPGQHRRSQSDLGAVNSRVMVPSTYNPPRNYTNEHRQYYQNEEFAVRHDQAPSSLHVRRYMHSAQRPASHHHQQGSPMVQHAYGTGTSAHGAHNTAYGLEPGQEQRYEHFAHAHSHMLPPLVRHQVPAAHMRSFCVERR